MLTEPSESIRRKIKRSLTAGFLTLALLFSLSTLLDVSNSNVFLLVVAGLPVLAVLLGLPDKIIRFTARRRGKRYFKAFSLLIPLCALVLLLFLGWVFWLVRFLNMLGIPVDLILGGVILAGLLNLAIFLLNIFTPD